MGNDVTLYTDLVYSQRPNYGGFQYTSTLRRGVDTTLETLDLHMDLALPDGPPLISPSRPAILMAHGGGFHQGGKEEMTELIEEFASYGFAVAAPNYRLTPEEIGSSGMVAVTTAMNHATEDIMNAVRYLKYYGDFYNIDTSRVAIIGFSAGGFPALATALGADEVDTWLSDYPGVSARLKGAVTTAASLTDGLWPEIVCDPADAKLLMFHAKPMDLVTGLTWNDDAVPTALAINEAGGRCILRPSGTWHGVNILDDPAKRKLVLRFLYRALELSDIG